MSISHLLLCSNLLRPFESKWENFRIVIARRVATWQSQFSASLVSRLNKKALRRVLLTIVVVRLADHQDRPYRHDDGVVLDQA